MPDRLQRGSHLDLCVLSSRRRSTKSEAMADLSARPQGRLPASPTVPFSRLSAASASLMPTPASLVRATRPLCEDTSKLRRHETAVTASCPHDLSDRTTMPPTATRLGGEHLLRGADDGCVSHRVYVRKRSAGYRSMIAETAASCTSSSVANNASMIDSVASGPPMLGERRCSRSAWRIAVLPFQDLCQLGDALLSTPLTTASAAFRRTSAVPCSKGRRSKAAALGFGKRLFAACSRLPRGRMLPRDQMPRRCSPSRAPSQYSLPGEASQAVP